MILTCLALLFGVLYTGVESQKLLEQAADDMLAECCAKLEDPMACIIFQKYRSVLVDNDWVARCALEATTDDTLLDAGMSKEAIALFRKGLHLSGEPGKHAMGDDGALPAGNSAACMECSTCCLNKMLCLQYSSI